MKVFSPWPVVALVACGMLGNSTAGYADLRASLKPAEYYGTAYTSAPQAPAIYVFFEGMPVVIDLEVHNLDADSEYLIFRDATPESKFRATLGTLGKRHEVRLLLSDEIRLRMGGMEFDTSVAENTEVPGNGSLAWRSQIEGVDRLAPGIYDIEVTPQMSAKSGRPIGVANRWTIEVRRPTALDRLELLRLSMMAAFTRDNNTLMDAAADELLRAYPSAHLVYVTRGHRANQAGRWTEAIHNYGQALTLLTTRADRIYLDLNPPQDVEHAIGFLTTTIQGLKSRK